MPTAVTDPFGNTFQACSISTAVKAKFNKDHYGSEAAWAKHVKYDAWNVLRTKIDGGEITKNTVLGRTPAGHKLVYKGDGYMELSKVGVQSKGMWKLQGFDATSMFKNNDWDFGPNMAKVAQQQKLIVDTPVKLEKWMAQNHPDESVDLVLLTSNTSGNKYVLRLGKDYDGNVALSMNKVGPFPGPPGHLSVEELTNLQKSGLWKVEYKVGQTPDVPPAAGLPVSSTSKSVGALTNEDAATLFVKTKDKLANEAGINIKGASGKLDDLVYKTIADQAGYTPAEMKAKVDAYKASGKKLSSLKKKVLPKSGNPTKAATQKSVDNATEAVKKEEIKPEEVPQVWDSEAVAKAYVKAKDHVVANNNHGWTLYTKNPDFDKEIHKWMQADLGPIKKETADTAIADYIANTQKLSVLKKQMIKKGELTPQADTLKGKKVTIADPDDLKKALQDNTLPVDSKVATLTDATGKEYQLTFEGMVGDSPTYKATFPSGTVQHWSHTDLKDVLTDTDFTIEYKLGKGASKSAPDTSKGGVGKATEDPMKIGPKQELSEEKKQEIFQQWESSDLPLSSSGEKLYNSAKVIAKQYNLGDDVLPILRAVDELKTKKFGYAPSQNKNLYEKKVLEHLANPKPAYTPPTHTSFDSNFLGGETFGDLPEDSSLFEEISDHRMNEIHFNSMGRPTPQQQSALRTYSGSSYREINGRLRSGGGIEGSVTSKHIQDSMKPMPADIIARRGTSLRGIGLNSFDELESSIGRTFVEPGFSSTAVGGSGQFSGQVNLMIQVPKGAKAVWLKPYSNIQGENELLLAAGTRFRILKVEVKASNWGSQTTTVHVRVEP